VAAISRRIPTIKYIELFRTRRGPGKRRIQGPKNNIYIWKREELHGDTVGYCSVPTLKRAEIAAAYDFRGRKLVAPMRQSD
jgi:hypothetical protein